MQKTSLQIPTIILALGIIIGILIIFTVTNFSGQDKHTEMSNVPDGMHQMPDGSLMRHGDMMMDHMNMIVNSEQAFIQGMIPHHQEAIDTAREVLERGGTTPQIIQLAQDIIVAQEAEIAMMKQWHLNWYEEAYSDVGEYVPMMRDLSQLNGIDLDKTFLEDMVMHHMGAVMMAGSVQSYIEHEEMTDLTQAVIETQMQEIQLMQNILSTL